MNDAPATLFVYGTLKQGQLNCPLLDPYARAVEPAWTQGVLYDFGLYPGLVAGAGIVHGELVQLDPATLTEALALLDRLEGYQPDDLPGSIYRREVVTVETAHGTQVRAYTYFYNHDPAGLPRVADGAWFAPPAATATATDSAFDQHVRTFLRRAANQQ
ncbi:MAG: gamma-glutamylcyclotransferase family protein [Thermomicrobiales bacterium]|jgi:gamma-glutamylcyclotransferase (GGCT)/AIG2-like uncharacterized protein YtfP|nr:gamma-glutamylcyclotransferase family protein [Thermomicrobiales bacterium]